MGLLPDYDPATGLPIISDRAGWSFDDFVRSFGSGLVRGGAMAVGLPGDLKRGVARAHNDYIRPVEQWFGYQGPSPETMQRIESERPSLTPTAEQAERFAASYLGEPYKPQTDPGSLAYEIGAKLPGLPLLALGGGRRR